LGVKNWKNTSSCWVGGGISMYFRRKKNYIGGKEKGKYK
jgi:hypothetical protein